MIFPGGEAISGWGVTQSRRGVSRGVYSTERWSVVRSSRILHKTVYEQQHTEERRHPCVRGGGAPNENDRKTLHRTDSETREFTHRRRRQGSSHTHCGGHCVDISREFTVVQNVNGKMAETIITKVKEAGHKSDRNDKIIPSRNILQNVSLSDRNRQERN